jgi:HK97 family phage portal protein
MKYLSFDYLKSIPKRLSSRNQLDPNNDALFTDVSGFQINRASDTRWETTVFSCVRVISEAISQLPCRLINDSDDGKESATGDPLYNVLLRSPNKWMTAFDFWKFYIMSLLYRGFSLNRVIRGSSGKVLQLIPYHPETVKITLLSDGTMSFEGTSIINIANKSFKKDKFNRDEAFYSSYATIDGFTPVSPVEWNMLTVSLSDEMRKNTKAFVGNDSTPPGVLIHPGTVDEGAQKRLRESWQIAQTGRNKGRVAILEQGMEFKAISVSNQEAQFLELRQFEKQEIAGIFGVPVDLISDTKQSKGWSTVEQQYLAFISGTLNPIMTRIEQSITMDLINKSNWNNKYANFDTKALLRGDIETRAKFYKDMIPLGVLSPNEARSMEDQSPRDGGDDFYRPTNLVIDAEDDTNTEDFENEHK